MKRSPLSTYFASKSGLRLACLVVAAIPVLLGLGGGACIVGWASSSGTVQGYAHIVAAVTITGLRWMTWGLGTFFALVTPLVGIRAAVGWAMFRGRGSSRPGGVMDALSWFFRGDSRENIRAAAGDLRRDVRSMHKKGCARAHILAVRFWITTTTLVPVLWDGCVRISKKLPMVGGWIRGASALVRKIDPPRPG